MALDLWITSKVRQRLLTLFVTHPDNEFYIRELERRIQADFQSVRQELLRLEAAGVLSSRRVANLKYYGLNKSYYLYPELCSMIAKTEARERVP